MSRHPRSPADSGRDIFVTESQELTPDRLCVLKRECVKAGERPALLHALGRPAALPMPNAANGDQNAWREQALAKLAECLGATPNDPPADARPVFTGRLATPNGTLHRVLLPTFADQSAVVWLGVPRTRTSPGTNTKAVRPALVCHPGHGLGAWDTLALTDTGTTRDLGAGYQRDFPLAAMALGYVVAVIEPLAMGERAPQTTPLQEDTSCRALVDIATMYGYTAVGLRVHEARKTIDWLETLACLDARRLGMLGISGGGTVTLFTAALEPRLKVAVVSGYINRFADSVLAMPHCPCNLVPGLAAWLDMADVAATLAPRPLLIQAGTQDAIFPIRGADHAVARLRDYYARQGDAAALTVDRFDGEHVWSGHALPAFLDKHLPLDPNDVGKSTT